MSDSPVTYALAAGLGAVAGLRSMAAPALLAHRLSGRRADDPAGRLLAEPRVASTLAVLAAGELAADKTPFIPARTEPAPLFGRIAMGALCGAAVAGRRRGSLIAGALVGAAGAAAGTFAGYHLRRAAGRRTGLPDVVLAIVEDGVALAGGAHLARRVG